ncbi:uncharacterized protein LOC110028241 [Phalaenopsis equestris]|uniref:uncharacterized protein LOC110028241 n=1 Tax=Phalaenopsis equestris TaxID=78828 RepID=UPI0009E5DE71|nr:uncharacterized protein LOC110028241 [Phalaenopsis equestris]
MSSPSRAIIGDMAVTKIGKEGNVTLSYPLLTKSNYSVWALKMRVNLQAQGVWEVVEQDEVEERKDRMALVAIYQALPEDVLLMVAEKDSAKQAWETLKTMHVGVERVKEAKVQTLRTHFEAIRMKDGETVDDFAMKLTSIVTVSVVKKFLRAVPQKYMQIVTAIEQFGDLKNMTVEEVVGRLKVHEERLRGYEDQEEEKHLLLTHAEWMSRMKKNGETDFSSGSLSSGGNGGDNRGRGKGQGRDGESSPQQEDIKPRKDKSTVKCYNCQRYGHYTSEFRS